jgi:hypothetical protein
MARNEVFRDADHLSLPVPDGTKSGDPLRIGGLNVVAETDVADAAAAVSDIVGPPFNTNPDGFASCWLKGAHDFPVEFAITNIGDPVYITAANELTEVATGNSLYGHALSTKTASAGNPLPLTVRIAN